MQSWNCVLEDCKVAKIIDIAMLCCWEKAGRAQNLLAGCIFVGEADKSAFALLSQKVTKEGLCPDTSRTTNVREGSMIMRRIRRSLPDKGEREIY